LLGGAGFKEATTHPEQVCAWWDATSDANIGAVPGSIGAVVMDEDGPEGERQLGALGVFDGETAVSTTGKGAHYWFTRPAGFHINNLHRAAFDVRGDGGYVVVPPSVHPSGATYAWRRSLDRIAPAPTALIEWLHAQLLVAPLAAEGTTPEAPQLRPTIRLVKPFTEITERRVLAYADRVGYGLSDGRKTSAFRFACFLLYDVSLDDAAAMVFLSTWNGHNAPPLSDRQLAQIFDNARQYGGRRASA
jgi:hypothetical protein